VTNQDLRASPRAPSPIPARRYDLRILSGGRPVGSGKIASQPEPLTTLRGASVGVDVRVVARVAVVVCLTALAVTAVVLFLAGLHKNDQINRLRNQGVHVVLTVSGCQGLMGGSGSNLVGYQCSGVFDLGGHRYTEPIPGNTFYSPGTAVQGVAVPGDPALLSTAAALTTEHTSGKVFILPGALLAVLALTIGTLYVWRRRGRTATVHEPAVASPLAAR
jgi:hypothetical protein